MSDSTQLLVRDAQECALRDESRQPAARVHPRGGLPWVRRRPEFCARKSHRPLRRAEHLLRFARSKRHPRYTIHINGCSPSVYAIIDEKTSYIPLLGLQQFLFEHPWETEHPEFLNSVKAMKPLMLMGNECYSWVGDSTLCDDNSDLFIPDEGITVVPPLTQGGVDDPFHG